MFATDILEAVGGGFGAKFCNFLPVASVFFSMRILWCYRPAEVEVKGEGGSRVVK